VAGLGPGAWVIILQAMATYTALASAYFFARPILRNQTAQANLTLLENAKSNNDALEDIRRSAVDTLQQRMVKRAPGDRLANRLGLLLLLISAVLFSVAVVVQTKTDEAFRPERHGVVAIPDRGASPGR
jgi:hypothetical protein